ncbi:uncharacterized protein DS421_2g41270 [Arachis hypogaea]|nr:uncharacterized protein DS421_2g41270 [Arachis hypogaea]
MFLSLFLGYFPSFFFSFRMATTKREKKLLNGETGKSICTIYRERHQLEQPVHLYILACTENGAIFKCGEVDTDLHGLVILFSTPIFYFLYLFIVALHNRLHV